MSTTEKKTIRSFVLRQGRMTTGQQQAFDEHKAVYCLTYTPKTPLNLEQVFERDAPTTVEIGFGMGTSLAEMAEKSPKRNFIGIEVHKPGVGSLINQAVDKNLKNLRILHHDAVEVLKQQKGALCFGFTT